MLLQRWDTDGNLEWTRTWGSSDYESGNSLDCYGDELFIAATAYSGSLTNSGEMLFLKFDTDGNLGWTLGVGGASEDRAFDIEANYRLPLAAITLRVAGDSVSFASHYQATYATLSSDGELTGVSTWAAPYSSTATCISVVSHGLLQDVYVAGHKSDSANEDVMLLQYGSGTVLAKSWGSTNDDESADGITRWGNVFYLVGYSRSFSPTGDGLLLGFSTDGALTLARCYDNPDSFVELNGIGLFPNSGLLLCGDTPASDSSAWNQVAASLTDLSGSWTDVMSQVTSYAPSGIVAAPALPAEEVTDGVFDTGSGAIFGDTLLLADPGL